MGDLKRELAIHAPKVKRLKQLEEQARGWYASSKGDETFVVEGNRYTLQIGQKANKRTVKNMAKLFTRLTPQVFLSICSVSLEALDRLLKPEEAAKYVSTERAGSRSLDLVHKPIEISAAAKRKAA